MTQHTMKQHALDPRDITQALDMLSLVTQTLAMALMQDDGVSDETRSTAHWAYHALDGMRQGLQFDDPESPFSPN